MKIDLSHIKAVHWDKVPVGSLVKFQAFGMHGVIGLKTGNGELIRFHSGHAEGADSLRLGTEVSGKWVIISPNLAELLYRTVDDINN